MYMKFKTNLFHNVLYLLNNAQQSVATFINT